MRPHNSTWQGCFGYWQTLFIREHVLSLGHAAWQGFVTQGRGMVVCNVAIADPSTIDWRWDGVEHTTHFVSEQHLPVYLRALRLESTLIDQLLKTAQSYDPTQEILLLIQNNDRVDINLLRHLAIAPAECYQQVQQRWTEFQVHSSFGGSHESCL